MGFSELFIKVENLPNDGYGLFQILFLGAVYGYFLMFASNLISDGSELLLLVPEWAGLIGSVVLPVLGAVPDGCIVLFSGMGPNAQEQLNVGVGALAGSTIMLLTVPWFLSIMAGRVDIDPVTKMPKYKNPKLNPPNRFDLHNTGVAVTPVVNIGAYVMLFTSVSYLLLQIPGMLYINASHEAQSVIETQYAKYGGVICTVFFFAYLYQQYRISEDSRVSAKEAELRQQERIEYIRTAIQTKKVSLTGVMTAELKKFRSKQTEEKKKHAAYQHNQEEVQPLNNNDRRSVSNSSNSLIHINFTADNVPEEFMESMHKILKPFFRVYDEDSSGTLEKEELVAVFRDMGEHLSPSEITQVFTEFDRDNSGSVDFKEFVAGTVKYVITHDLLLQKRHDDSMSRGSFSIHLEEGSEHGDDESEAEEVPEDIKDLSPDEQQQRIKFRAAMMMLCGTMIILLFSDPMVDVLSELGKRTGIPAFYIAFVLAPLASNAPELIATYNYSMKKTETSISISMATLEGAAVMNNTFCLGIFMLLIWSQGLVWEFFAETLSILLVQLVMVYFALKKKHTLFDGLLILSLYPLSLVLVAVLEAYGWD